MIAAGRSGARQGQAAIDAASTSVIKVSEQLARQRVAANGLQTMRCGIYLDGTFVLERLGQPIAIAPADADQVIAALVRPAWKQDHKTWSVERSGNGGRRLIYGGTTLTFDAGELAQIARFLTNFQPVQQYQRAA